MQWDSRSIPFRSQFGRFARMCGYRNRFDLFNSEYLQSLGFNVKTIVDAGVEHGTETLYKAFEDCFFVLVDPRRNVTEVLQHKPARYSYVNKALGATQGRLILKEQDGGKTSLLDRAQLTKSPIRAEYDVEMTTLDEILDNTEFKGPIGIKLDTEGYELEVMKGLNKYKNITEFVICEANVRKRFVGSYEFSELIEFMLKQDFLFFNFLNPTNPHPIFYDIIFVQRNSKLLD